EAITVDYTEGGVIEVPQHDGSIIKLRKLSASYDPTDRIGAQDQIAQAAVKGEVLTGLLYLAPDAEDLHAHLNTYAVPFNQLGEKAPHIQPVLSRDQFDVLVRKPEVPGVTQQRDAPRCVCKLAEVLDQPVPLELKYRLRRTNRDQDARASGLFACREDRLEKG